MKSTRIKMAGAAGRLSLLALAIGAGSLAMADEPAWYLGANVGQGHSSIDAVRVGNGLLGSGAYVNSIGVDERDLGYKIFGGYQFNRYIAVEGGYFDLGRFGFNATTVPSGSLSGEIKVRGESSGKHLLAPWIDVGPAVVVASYAANQDPATQVLGGAVPGTWPSGTVGYVLGKLSPTALTLVSPITAGGAISVVQGCDYRAVDGYALDQTLSSSLPGLSGAGTPIVALFTGPRAAAPFAYVTGNSILGAGTATQKLRMEPTAAQTAALALGSFYYRATIPLVDGNVIEIATSTFQVTLF